MSSENYGVDGQYAPNYTVVDRRYEGADVITTVVIDGELTEFIIPRFQKENLEGRLGGQNE